MFDVRAMPPQVDPELLALLAQCRTESIGHHRHWGLVHGAIRPVMPERRVVGTAVTVAAPGHDSGMVTHLLGMLRPGDFICIDRLGDNHNACWGGTSPITCHPYGMGGAINIPVSVGGAVVLPGYAVLADESGVLVLPPDEIGYLTRMALDRQVKSAANLDRIRAGENQGNRMGLTGRIEAGLEGERKLREQFGG